MKHSPTSKKSPMTQTDADPNKIDGETVGGKFQLVFLFQLYETSGLCYGISFSVTCQII